MGAVLALSVIGLIWNIFSLIEYIAVDAVKIVGCSFIILFNLALTVLVISVMTCGNYVIKDKTLLCCFGLIRTPFNIDDIVGITHFKKSNKLVVYFKDKKYTVIVISSSQYEEFIMTMREINHNIIYDTRIDGEDTPQ